MAVQAAKEFDFDEALMSAASKFEQLPQEKKIPVVGYGIAAAAAIITAEWCVWAGHRAAPHPPLSAEAWVGCTLWRIAVQGATSPRVLNRPTCCFCHLLHLPGLLRARTHTLMLAHTHPPTPPPGRFIHLPLFDFLLGFPIQLLGLLSLPYLGIRVGAASCWWTRNAQPLATAAMPTATALLDSTLNVLLGRFPTGGVQGRPNGTGPRPGPVAAVPSPAHAVPAVLSAVLHRPGGCHPRR